MKVLINAYAISPNHGSELGVGWKWVTELAKYCQVFVITESEFEIEIKEALEYLPQKENLKFYFNDIGVIARAMCWNQGDYRFYWFYRNWQKETFKIAEEISSKNSIDLIHQLNMIGYREPGYLWKLKDIPFVWGPVGGFNFMPTSFMMELGLNKAFFYAFKNSLNYVQAISNIRVKRAVHRSDMIFSASHSTQNSILKFFNKKSILFNETGCEVASKKSMVLQRKSFSEKMKIIWVGRFIPTKMLGLALKSIAKCKTKENFEFHIVGEGVHPDVMLKNKKMAVDLNIEEICFWHGKVERSRVDELMQSSDLMFFTSVVEATSTVVFEALSNDLPILCFDTCGHGKVVNENVGVKIPLENPQKAIQKFSKSLDYLFLNREKLQMLSENCNKLVEKYSWKNKGVRMIQYYKNLLNI